MAVSETLLALRKRRNEARRYSFDDWLAKGSRIYGQPLQPKAPSRKKDGRLVRPSKPSRSMTLCNVRMLCHGKAKIGLDRNR